LLHGFAGLPFLFSKTTSGETRIQFPNSDIITLI
jgi:hypothetical protein